MHIKIVGFKIHVDAEFIFQSNEMTLLKGKSEAGKSTILQAIYWVLYGNMRNIYNNLAPNKNLSVTLNIPGMTVFRKKNPELLTVTLVNGQSYQDVIAQSVINDTYGNKDLWRACSYIEQKARCSLLSGSAAERMELLNALSFTGETPKEYIHKISQKLKEVALEFEKFQSSFTTELNIYSDEIKRVKCKSNPEEIHTLKNSLCEMESKMIIMKEKVLQEERLLGKYNYIQSNIQNIKKELSNFLDTTDVEIPEHLYKPISFASPGIPLISFAEYSKTKRELKNKLDSVYHIISERERLKKELQGIRITEVYDYPKVTKEQIWSIENSEKQRDTYIQSCKNMGLEYKESIIQETLAKLSEQLSVYTKLENQISNYQKLLQLEEKIGEYTIQANVEDLEKLKEEKSLAINDLKKGLELLTCPQCKTPLRYQNNNLILGERNPVSKSEISQAEMEYSQLLENIQKLRYKLKLEENIRELNKCVERESIATYLENRPDLQKLSSLINKISNIKFITIDTSSDYLKKVYEYQEKVDKKNKFEKELQILHNKDTSVHEFQEKLKKLESTYTCEQARLEKEQEQIRECQRLESNRLVELKKYENQKNKVKEKCNLENKLKDLQKELSGIQLNENVKREYNELETTFNQKQEKLKACEYAVEIMKKGKVLEEKRNKLLCLQKDVQSLNKLKLKAVDVECKQLEDTINNINTVLETTLPIFFDDPISLKLLLYKKVKKNESLKPGLNLEISYRGCKYYNLNDLSGGAGDRISLALLLALNFVSNSPLILLDECVSSLDGELKEKCITAIKSIPNKTVVCIDHDDTLEGFYDSVINI